MDTDRFSQFRQGSGIEVSLFCEIDTDFGKCSAKSKEKLLIQRATAGRVGAFMIKFYERDGDRVGDRDKRGT